MRSVPTIPLARCEWVDVREGRGPQPYLQADCLAWPAAAHDCREVEVVAADDALHILRGGEQGVGYGQQWRVSAQTGGSSANEHVHE